MNPNIVDFSNFPNELYWFGTEIIRIEYNRPTLLYHLTDVFGITNSIDAFDFEQRVALTPYRAYLRATWTKSSGNIRFSIYDYMAMFSSWSSQWGSVDSMHDELRSYAKRNVDLMDIWYEGMKPNDPSLPFNVLIGEDISFSKLYNFTDIQWADKHINKFKASLYSGQIFVAHLIPPKLYLYELPELDIFKPKIDKFLYCIDTAVPEEEEIFISFMGVKIVKKISGKVLDVLTRRYEIFCQSPTPTNVVLMFQTMEAIIMNKAKEGDLDSFLEGTGGKALERFEKLKNLALSTQHSEERQSAADKCYKSFQKLMGEVR